LTQLYDRAIVSAMGTAIIKWITLSKQSGFWIQGVSPLPSGVGLWLEYVDYKVISEWCRENKCGKRMSYNQFKFDSEADMTWFLLRWS